MTVYDWVCVAIAYCFVSLILGCVLGCIIRQRDARIPLRGKLPTERTDHAQSKAKRRPVQHGER